MIGRRMFLKVASTAGVMARRVAEEQVKNLTILGGEDKAPLAEGIGLASSRYYDEDDDGVPLKKRYDFMRGYLKLWGRLPDFIDEDARDRAKNVHCLDPDIACKVSWSLNVKIQHQQERNYQRSLERYRRIGLMKEAQERFKELTGFKWER